MKIDQKYLTEDDIGYMVTPRLNAASRMDNPMRAFELLATEDVTEASVLADHLTKINDERKDIVNLFMTAVSLAIAAEWAAWAANGGGGAPWPARPRRPTSR